MDVLLQLLLLQRKGALLGRQPAFLLPLGLQRLLALLPAAGGLLGLLLKQGAVLPQAGQLFLQLPGGKHAALPFVLQFPDRVLIVGDGVLLDGGVHLGLGNGGFPLPDTVPLMLDVKVQLLCFLLDLLGLPFDLLQPLLGGGSVIGGQKGLILQLGHLPSQLCQLLQPQADLQRFFLLGQHHVLLGLFALRLQGAYPVLQLLHDIPQSDEVILGLGQLALRFGFAVAELGDAGGFLEDLPPLGAFGAHDLRNFPLLDDRIAIPSQAGIHKGLVDILEPDGVIVDAVFAFSAAVQPPGDDHLIGIDIDAAVGIIDKKAHPCKAGRLSGSRPAEDHILHLGAAQALHRLLAEYPLDGVADIAFSAAVRPDDHGDPVIKGQLCAVGEGLKSLHFHRFQLHGISSCFSRFYAKSHTDSY